MPGTLFVVATPIGNLEDLSFRALRTLREVDLIAAEDTRRTAKLLAHYEIQKSLVSLRQQNEIRETPRLLDRIAAGQSVALVSDAGTPTIADPGARLVHAAHDRRIRVIAIPGPSAVAAALSVSGFAGDEFVFMGFPPPTGAVRQKWIDRAAAEPRTIVFFEAPHRIERTLKSLAPQLVMRQILVHRELSKINEESVEYQINAGIRRQGEFVVVIGPSGRDHVIEDLSPDKVNLLAAIFGYMTDNRGVHQSDAATMLSKAFEVPERTVRKLVKKHRILVKRQIDAAP